MELPFHLKTIEPLPGALDILRFFGRLEEATATADEIIDVLDLSDRRFSKAIRRLVTKGYLQMDGDMIYRLSEQGHTAISELREYDGASGDADDKAGPPPPAEPEKLTITRRMTLVTPESLVSGKPATIVIGFYESTGVSENAAVVVRVSVLNGDPEASEDVTFSLDSGPAQQTIQIVAGAYTQARIRLEAYQLGDNPDDIDAAGGMYVDLPVTAEGLSGDLTAFGADINLTQ